MGGSWVSLECLYACMHRLWKMEASTPTAFPNESTTFFQVSYVDNLAETGDGGGELQSPCASCTYREHRAKSEQRQYISIPILSTTFYLITLLSLCQSGLVGFLVSCEPFTAVILVRRRFGNPVGAINHPTSEMRNWQQTGVQL